SSVLPPSLLSPVRARRFLSLMLALAPHPLGLAARVGLRAALPGLPPLLLVSGKRNLQRAAPDGRPGLCCRTGQASGENGCPAVTSAILRNATALCRVF